MSVCSHPLVSVWGMCNLWVLQQHYCHSLAMSSQPAYSFDGQSRCTVMTSDALGSTFHSRCPPSSCTAHPTSYFSPRPQFPLPYSSPLLVYPLLWFMYHRLTSTLFSPLHLLSFPALDILHLTLLSVLPKQVAIPHTAYPPWTPSPPLCFATNPPSSSFYFLPPN